MSATKERSWQTQESRTVRPFRFADECLKDAAVRLYSDEEFRTTESFRIDALDLEKLAVAVWIPSVFANFEDLVGIPPDSLRLAVTVEDLLYKDSLVALQVPILELNEARVLEIEPEKVNRLSWGGIVRLHVAVVLAVGRNGRLGTARRVGSWLARKTFTIGNLRETTSFAVEAVDPVYFEKRGLPKSSTYLVEVIDADLNQSCEHLPELIKVSLAKDVHSALARDESSSMSKAIVNAIYVDVVTTILVAGYSALVGEVEKDTILDVVTSRLQRESGVTTSRLREFAKEPGAAQLRAIVQASSNLSRALVSAAQRKAS